MILRSGSRRLALLPRDKLNVKFPPTSGESGPARRSCAEVEAEAEAEDAAES